MASRRKHKAEEEETTYWLSYSDMMAALLLIFVLIISFTMMQAKKQYEKKQYELEAQQKVLEDQQEILEKQKEQIQQQQDTMDAQQQQLDKLIGVKSDLISALKEEFEGTDLKVSVDEQTGAITFDSSILFDINKYDLKTSGESFLKQFLPKYLSVLLSKDYRGYISEIIIEGHTDTNGEYLMNLELSQRRALSVAKFCLAENSVLSGKEVGLLRNIVTANGRSFSNPIFKKDGTVNMSASRRVEFKFRLKDDEMVSEMIDIFNEE